MSSCEHTLNTLRYADRVKELGVADPAQVSSKGDNQNGKLQEDGMSPEDLDLAQLRTLNQGELSADWYNFQVRELLMHRCYHHRERLFNKRLERMPQETISHLQALEDDLVESHRTTIESMRRWIKQDSQLIKKTNQVDYDQDGKDAAAVYRTYCVGCIRFCNCH